MQNSFLIILHIRYIFISSVKRKPVKRARGRETELVVDFCSNLKKMFVKKHQQT